jgi:hypothetical protein
MSHFKTSLTEVESVEQVLVEQNNGGTQSNPGTVQRYQRFCRMCDLLLFQLCSRYVDRGVEGRARLLLLSGGVDGRQRLLSGSLARGADLLAFAHCECFEGLGLIRKKALEFERSWPREASLIKGGGSHEEKWV